MRDDTSWVLPCCSVIISGGKPALEHVIGRIPLWRDLTVLYFDIIIRIRGDTFVVWTGLATNLWCIGSLLIRFVIDLALDWCAVACPAPLSRSSNVLLLLLLLLLVLHVGDVWHVLRDIRVHMNLLLVLSSCWKEWLWRILADDDIFLYAAIAVMLLDFLRRLLINIHVLVDLLLLVNLVLKHNLWCWLRIALTLVTRASACSTFPASCWSFRVLRLANLIELLFTSTGNSLDQMVAPWAVTSQFRAVN